MCGCACCSTCRFICTCTHLAELFGKPIPSIVFLPALTTGWKNASIFFCSFFCSMRNPHQKDVKASLCSNSSNLSSANLALLNKSGNLRI